MSLDGVGTKEENNVQIFFSFSSRLDPESDSRTFKQAPAKMSRLRLRNAAGVSLQSARTVGSQ